MPGSYDWRWPELIAPFLQVLTPTSQIAPVLGGCDTIVGQFHGEPV